MKYITWKEIDEVVNKAFISVVKDMPIDFLENCEIYRKCVENNVPKSAMEAFRWGYPYFAAMKTVQDNMVEVIKRSLEELLCGENENGYQENTINNSV